MPQVTVVSSVIIYFTVECKSSLSIVHNKDNNIYLNLIAFFMQLKVFAYDLCTPSENDIPSTSDK